MLLEAGQVIDGKYRLVRLIGTGGMGAVYEGENVLIRRRVAIKVLNAGSTGNVDVIRRFEREAQAAGEIGNDHILEVLDLGSLPDGDRYMVMEYLDGETLAARIEHHGRLTPAQIAPIARQFLAALAAAHAAGIIHRDLKPENIFILRSKAGRADFVKLIDFGISKFSRPFKDGEHRMTRADAIFGTPCYMSPEQARGAAEADVRSDIYSCGVILFEAVTGRLPFEGDSFNDLMFKIALQDAPTPLSIVPSVDPEFSWIVSHAIARDPDSRFSSVQEFAETLDDWMRKNAMTETLALPQASDAFPARRTASEPPTNSTDPTNPEAQNGVDIRETSRVGSDESWAHSKGDAPAKNRRGARLAAALVVGLAIVGVGVALAVHAESAKLADPAPSPSAVLSAPAVAAVAQAVQSPDSPQASSSSEPPGSVPSSKPKRDAPSRQVSGARSPSSAPISTKPKGAATAPAKGFDLGY